MKKNAHPVTTFISSSLVVSLLALSACGKKEDATQLGASEASAVTDASAAQVASSAPAYTPPTAEQLYQMVAPIALFPDKLVALVLAGATYPEQITAADQWLKQNPSLKGDALTGAANQQPWDPSVKGLTVFPAVLSQMAQNIAWTTSLGQAYYNDPSDVMNAIQVMRARAQSHGNLKTSQRVTVTPVARADSSQPYGSTPVYAGPAIIAPPPQTIVIEPAQPDVVYVPAYDPGVVYGEPVPAYPGYRWRPPAHNDGNELVVGALSFGVGVAVGAAVVGHYGWGWHAWGVNWGGRPPERSGGEGRPQQWQRPAVVYNNAAYVSKSTTVINHISNTRITNNYVDTNNNTTNNTVNNNTTNERINNVNAPGRAPGAQPMDNNRPPANAARPDTQAHAPTASTPTTVPHFGAHDARAGAQPDHAAPAREGAQHSEGDPRAADAAHPNSGSGPRDVTRIPPTAAADHSHALSGEQAHPGGQPQGVRHPAPAPHQDPAARQNPAPHPEPAAHQNPAPRLEPAAHQNPTPHPEPVAHPNPAPRPEPAAHQNPAPHQNPEPHPHPHSEASAGADHKQEQHKE